jgi:heme oxygenase
LHSRTEDLLGKKLTKMLHDRNEGGLRKRVRSALAEDHERVDAKFAELDFQSRDGLATFLQAHRAAFGAILMTTTSFDGRIKEAHLKDIIKALDADLKALRVPVYRLSAPDGAFDPLAVDHIVLGSRLGTAVLRAKWLMSADRQVRQARSYFAQPQMTEEWRAHCMELSAMDASDNIGQQLIEDARKLFELFERALDVCR